MLEADPPAPTALIPLSPWLPDVLLPFPERAPVPEEAAPDGPAPEFDADKAPPPDVPGGG